MKLYGFPPSPNTRKIQALAAHVGVPVELVLVDLSKGEQKKPDYLAINPAGRTPTLVDGDLELSESNAILQYVAGAKPSSLWPDDRRQRADITRWQCWQLAHWDEGCVGLIRENVIKKVMGMGAPDPAAVKAAETAFARDASVLDRHLATQQYLVGNTLTIADFAVAAPLAYAEAASLPLSDYPNIRAWYARIASLPAWKEANPAM